MDTGPLLWISTRLALFSSKSGHRPRTHSKVVRMDYRNSIRIHHFFLSYVVPIWPAVISQIISPSRFGLLRTYLSLLMCRLCTQLHETISLEIQINHFNVLIWTFSKCFLKSFFFNNDFCVTINIWIGLPGLFTLIK